MNQGQSPLMDALQGEGVLVSASVKYWRGKKRLKAEDIGLKPDSVDDRLIALGQKRLVTREVLAGFALIESRTHAAIEAASFPFLGGIARFVPNRKIRDLRETLVCLRVEFNQLVDRFVQNYEGTRAESLSLWRYAADRLDGDSAMLLRTIEESFPSSFEIRDYFTLDYQFFQVTAPESVQIEAYDEAERHAVAAARAEAAAEARLQIKLRAEAFVAESVSTLRSETAKLCEEVLATLSGSPSVHQKTLNRLTNFIDRFHDLNFANDDEMAAQLDELKRTLATNIAADYRDGASSKSTLVEGLSNLRDRARELARADTSALVQNFGDLGRRKFAGVA